MICSKWWCGAEFFFYKMILTKFNRDEIQGHVWCMDAWCVDVGCIDCIICNVYRQKCISLVKAFVPGDVKCNVQQHTTAYIMILAPHEILKTSHLDEMVTKPKLVSRTPAGHSRFEREFFVPGLIISKSFFHWKCLPSIHQWTFESLPLLCQAVLILFVLMVLKIQFNYFFVQFLLFYYYWLHNRETHFFFNLKIKRHKILE